MKIIPLIWHREARKENKIEQINIVLLILNYCLIKSSMSFWKTFLMTYPIFRDLRSRKMVGKSYAALVPRARPEGVSKLMMKPANALT